MRGRTSDLQRLFHIVKNYDLDITDREQLDDNR